eukprot:839851-Prymnesium_polylepis.1
MLKPLKGEWGARHGGSQAETAQMCLLKPGRVGQVDSENYGASGHRHLGERTTELSAKLQLCHRTCREGASTSLSAQAIGATVAPPSP